MICGAVGVLRFLRWYGEEHADRINAYNAAKGIVFKTQAQPEPAGEKEWKPNAEETLEAVNLLKAEIRKTEQETEKIKTEDMKSMTEQEYNLAEGIRRSDLWKMQESPEKFKYFLEHPVEQTPAMAFGSACHMKILEPKEFEKNYALAPNVNRTTKAGKEEWERFMEANAGKTPMKQEDMDTLEDMRTALKACPLADQLMFGRNGRVEVPLFWKDPETGKRCKAKCDRINRTEDGKYVIIDYKTTTCAETEAFNREIFRYGYYFQAGFYTEGLMNALHLDYRPRFIFVAQEKKAPYAVNVIEVSEDVMNVGVAKYHELLNKYHTCKELDEWGGYLPVDGGYNWTNLPAWFDDSADDM